MNINLANIDFVPGQGGSGEAVIRSLDVTENGTYSAPSGVDGYSPVNVNVSGGGSLTPEEQAALDTLVDSSEGVLYTKEYRQNIAERNSNPSQNSPYMFKESLCKLGNDIYAYDGSSLYKLNRNKLIFEKIFTQDNTSIQNPLWMDSKGRIYTGNVGQLDITNETVIELPNMNFNNYNGNDYRHINIFYGKYGVYSLGDTTMKFDEETQQFIEWNITKPDNTNISIDIQNYGFWFDNHYITASGNNMYEIKEYEDHLEFLIVTEPYFPLTVNGNYIFNDYSRFCVVNEELYYFNYSGPSYHLVSGEWEEIPFETFRYNNGDYTRPIYFSDIFESIDSYIILYDSNIGENYYLVLNIGNTDIKTNWVSIDTAGAVDKVSKQEISGQKTFNSPVSFKSSIRIESISSSKNIYISAAQDIILTTNKNVSTNGDLLIKGNLAATIDNTFVNIDELPFGTLDKIVYVNSDGRPYKADWFSVDNRIFRRNDDSTFYEFNGIGLDREHPITFSLSADDSFSTNDIYTTENGTYLIGNYNIYKWDNTHTNWVMLSGVSSFGNDMLSYWYDGTNLRHSNNMILVNNNDTYSWVEDSSPLDTWYNGYYFMDNGNVYVWCDSDWRFRQYDSTHKTYTDIGPGNYFVQYKTYLGKTFFVYNNNPSDIVYFDITKASQDHNNEPLTLTGVSLESTGYFFGVYGNNIYYFKDYADLSKSYGLNIQKPAVPATDGTYTLKAVRVGDQITYNWVLDAK